VIGPLGELYSETNDNPVAILLTYGMARVLLAGEAKARKEEHSTERFVHEALNGHQRFKLRNSQSQDIAPY
jgi:hypothetical protein